MNESKKDTSLKKNKKYEKEIESQDDHTQNTRRMSSRISNNISTLTKDKSLSLSSKRITVRNILNKNDVSELESKSDEDSLTEKRITKRLSKTKTLYNENK